MGSPPPSWTAEPSTSGWPRHASARTPVDGLARRPGEAHTRQLTIAHLGEDRQNPLRSHEHSRQVRGVTKLIHVGPDTLTGTAGGPSSATTTPPSPNTSGIHRAQYQAVHARRRHPRAQPPPRRRSPVQSRSTKRSGPPSSWPNAVPDWLIKRARLGGVVIRLPHARRIVDRFGTQANLTTR